MPGTIVSMANNPFDLGARSAKPAGRGGAAPAAWRGGAPHLPGAPPAKAARPPREISEPKQAELLKNYVRVPEKHWPSVRYGSHVRYIGTDGAFRSGGFVTKNPLDVKPKDGPREKRYLKIQNSFNAKSESYRSWLVAYDDLQYLYVRPDAVELTTRDDVRSAIVTLNKNNRALAEHAKKLEARVARLERELGAS